MTILLVDDDEDDRDFFIQAVALVDPLCTVVPAHNGIEGLRLLEQGIRPDHIFLDVNMPSMDGLECLKEIQKRFPDVTSSLTILSTSQDYKRNLNEIKLSVHYYTKPNTFDALISIIKKRIHSDA